MTTLYILKKVNDAVKVRFIHLDWYEEHVLTKDKSFVKPEEFDLLEEGRYFTCFRPEAHKFKLLAVEPCKADDRLVQIHERIMTTLPRGDKGEDPIEVIRKDAQKLRRKKVTNDWFGNTRNTIPWLIRKRLEEKENDNAT